MLILPSQKKTGKILSSRKPKNDEAILHIFELSKQNVPLELFGFQFRKTVPKTNFFPLENFIIKFITNITNVKRTFGASNFEQLIKGRV